MPRRRLLFIGGTLLVLLLSGVTCTRGRRELTEESCLRHYTNALQPLERELGIRRWQAASSDSQAVHERLATAEKKIAELYADPKLFGQLRVFRDSKSAAPQVRRQLEILYNLCLPYQAPGPLRDKLASLEGELNREYRQLRFVVQGREVSLDEAYGRLRRASQPRERKAYWEAILKSLKPFERGFRNLILLRNQVARSLDFRDYFDMALSINGINRQEFLALLDDLEFRSSGPFARLTSDISKDLARAYQITDEQVRPWHYRDPFSLGKSLSLDIDLDSLYQNRDPIRIGLDFFKALDMDLATVVQRSGLYKKRAKESEAYKIFVDREYDYSLLLKPTARWECPQDYDVRIVMNVAPRADSMAILLHEMGHAAYLEHVDKTLPYMLRQEANIAMSEAVALFFGSLVYDPRWIESFMGVPADYLQAHLVDIRRRQVNEQLANLLQKVCRLRFEQALYENPEQDLNALWRRLAERYQGIKMAGEWDNPDYLYPFDVVQWPVLGSHFIYAFLVSSHIRHYLERHYAQSDINSGRFYWPAIARFFKEKLFASGATFPWSELLEKATGEKLDPAHFFSEFTGIQG